MFESLTRSLVTSSLRWEHFLKFIIFFFIYRSDGNATCATWSSESTRSSATSSLRWIVPARLDYMCLKTRWVVVFKFMVQDFRLICMQKEGSVGRDVEGVKGTPGCSDELRWPGWAAFAWKCCKLKWYLWLIIVLFWIHIRFVVPNSCK